jgi:hypothetical protein
LTTKILHTGLKIKALKLVCLILLLSWVESFAAEDTVKDSLMFATQDDGDQVSYMLTTNHANTVKYAFIVMPGGVGLLKPEQRGDTVWFMAGGNFLIRSRNLFVDQETIVAATDATKSTARMLAIVNDLSKRYPNVSIYITGTSRSTYSTMSLAKSLDGKVAGFIHTSSMGMISGFDTRKLKSRQLLVHHQEDGCLLTPYQAALSNHEDYGTNLITLNGGLATGNPCEAAGFHGYNGIEQETVDKIKDWVKSN